MRRRKGTREPELTISNTSYLTGKRRGAILVEQLWTLDGEPVKYILAYIDPKLCGKDNGRVLGYDNSHGYHHRHACGEETAVEFSSYEELVTRFEAEVLELWRKQDEN